jgi:hypothetical protein
MEEVVKMEDYLNSKDLFDAFTLQLTKDFEQSNFPSDFIKDLPADYTRIHQKIVDELHRSETRADTNLMNLLYRIDISEAQLKKYLHEHADKNHLSVIAGLIIKRVLQKVVIKKYYKRSENL